MQARPVLALVSAFAVLLGAAVSVRAEGSDAHAATTTFRSTLSREQVRAELLQAQREGRIVNGDTAAERALLDAALREPSGVTRAQVRAELLEARRLGLLDRRHEIEPTQATPAQAASIRQAGERAAAGALTLATK